MKDAYTRNISLIISKAKYSLTTQNFGYRFCQRYPKFWGSIIYCFESSKFFNHASSWNLSQYSITLPHVSCSSAIAMQCLSKESTVKLEMQW